MTNLTITSPPSIEFDNVSKIYKLGSGHASLRSAITGIFDRFRKNGDDETEEKSFAALNQTSFKINRGDSVAFIGPNGSGKTTTLKLISKITKETHGTITTRGRLSALIELGAGFHPELTGRENVYFNAAILGMRREEIQERFDEIVEFSGLERFLDTPVKRYSSGMYCRLGFAVAAHVNPDILLVDEVLAVGDSTFQAKCLKRMGELRANGTTIIFVTHNLGYLQRLCNRAIFIYKGNVMQDGPVGDVISTYRDHTALREKEAQDKKVEALACEPEITAPGIDLDIAPLDDASPVKITDVYFSTNQQRVESVPTGAPLTVHGQV